jgi:hypothetical protein
MLGSGARPEDGSNMFLRNVGIYWRVYTAAKPRRTTPSRARDVCSLSGSVTVSFTRLLIVLAVTVQILMFELSVSIAG